MSARITAPDGIRWPRPFVAVSHEEQRPWCFGWKPSPTRGTDRSIVASDERADGAVFFEHYSEPFHLLDAHLHSADYWLVGPDGPLDKFVGVERKEADACSSLTIEMDRFKEMCDRLREFTCPAIVLSCTWEALRRRYPKHEAALLGAAAMIAVRYRIPIFPTSDRAAGELFAAWILWEQWCSYLAVNPLALTWAREEERRRGITRERKRLQRKAAASSMSASMLPPAEQYDAPTLGLRAGRGRR